MKVQEIKFQGDEFILLGKNEGSIATERQLRNGYSAYAHLFGNGNIMRHGEVIGTLKDIEYLGEMDIELSLEDAVEMLFSMLNGEGWPW